mgnify:FL=1|nr:hypothetical protein [uncultured Anaerobutyricum sp.]
MLERWIIRHWIALTAGSVATGIVLHITYAIRGQLVIGGEWTIIPMMFLIEYFIREGKRRKTLARIRRNQKELREKRLQSGR